MRHNMRFSRRRYAILILTYGNHVRPELDHFAIVGHSLGGGITAEMAVLAEDKSVFRPRKRSCLFNPSSTTDTMMKDFHNILLPRLLARVVGENDTVVGNYSGKMIFSHLGSGTF